MWKRIGKGKKKTPKPVKDKKPKYKPDSSRKEKELSPAIALARSIAEINDKKGTSIPTVLLLLNALRFRFSWIKGFKAVSKGVNRFRLIMLASEHTVDENYTPGNVKYEQDYKRAVHAKKHSEWNGKTVEELMDLMNDVRRNGTPYVAGNGNKIYKKGNTLLIENFQDHVNYGTIFIRNESSKSIAKYIKNYLWVNR